MTKPSAWPGDETLSSLILSCLSPIDLAQAEVTALLRKAAEKAWEETALRESDCRLLVGLAGATWKSFSVTLLQANSIELKLCREIASSTDRPSENVSNTLVDSPCYQSSTPNQNRNRTNLERTPPEVLQYTCGCASGLSCYWCSAADKAGDRDDWLSFQLGPPGGAVVVVQGFGYQVYTAHWQPNAPNFAPSRVRLSLSVERNSPPYYVSKWHNSECVEALQRIVLPKPVVCIGGTYVSLQFRGKQQRQTLTEAPDDFYICISRFKLFGAQLPWLLDAPTDRSNLEVAAQATTTFLGGSLRRLPLSSTFFVDNDDQNEEQEDQPVRHYVTPAYRNTGRFWIRPTSKLPYQQYSEIGHLFGVHDSLKSSGLL